MVQSVGRLTGEYDRECIAKRKMFRWMSGITREDRIRNEYVRGSINVVSIVDKMRKN
jgi:hypothetical protein